MSATAFQRRRRELARRQEATQPVASPPPPTGDLPESLDAKVRALLTENGFGTLESVHEASDEQLLEIKGIGPKLLSEIRSTTE